MTNFYDKWVDDRLGNMALGGRIFIYGCVFILLGIGLWLMRADILFSQYGCLQLPMNLEAVPGTCKVLAFAPSVMQIVMASMGFYFLLRTGETNRDMLNMYRLIGGGLLFVAFSFMAFDMYTDYVELHRVGTSPWLTISGVLIILWGGSEFLLTFAFTTTVAMFSELKADISGLLSGLLDSASDVGNTKKAPPKSNKRRSRSNNKPTTLNHNTFGSLSDATVRPPVNQQRKR